MDKKNITYVTIAFELYQNKIMGQLKAWERQGYEYTLLYIEKMHDEYLLQKMCKTMEIETIASSHARNTIFRKLFDYLLNNCGEDDLLYIRRIGINIVYAGNYFRKANCRILYEIPTYPIDSGITLMRKIVLFLEKLYYKVFVYPYITAEPACVQKYSKTMPSKIVPIYNAVTVSDNIKDVKIGEEYQFIFFGNLQPWHGLEFFIKALQQYKGDHLTKLYIFSPLTPHYSQLKEKYNHLSNIMFEGKTSKEMIEQMVTRKTIGVGGLQYTSRGAEYDTSLKNKDYASIGIPFIYKLKDLSFPEYPYAYQVVKENEISISDIIDWHSGIDSETLYYQIKNYARKNLTYDEQVRIVRERAYL